MLPGIHLPFFQLRACSFAAPIPCFPNSCWGYNAPTYLLGTPRRRCFGCSAAGAAAKGEAVMGLQISARKSGNVTILDLAGRIIIGASNDALGTELRKLAEAGPSDVLVNLAAVTQ